jgi:uncharacterized protein (TIGR00725 family)
MPKKIIAVIGAGQCDGRIYGLAEEVGRRLAEKGVVIICGGLGGVMEAACKGAKEAGGETIGILPGDDTFTANAYVDIPVATGMGIGRNIIIIRSAQAVIAVNGSYGTLSELAYALQLQKPIVGLETWDVSDKIVTTSNPQKAVSAILELIDEI